MSLAGPHPNLALDTYLLNVGRPTHHLGSKRGELKHPWAGALRKFQFLLPLTAKTRYMQPQRRYKSAKIELARSRTWVSTTTNSPLLHTLNRSTLAR
jgi:hypothetical protein